MKIYSEESFGPVKAIVRVRGDEEAVACANDNEYGLSVGILGVSGLLGGLGVATEVLSQLMELGPRSTARSSAT